MDALVPQNAPHTSSIVSTMEKHTNVYQLDVITAQGAPAQFELLYICARSADATTEACRYDRLRFCFHDQLPSRLKGLVELSHKKYKQSE